MEKKGLTKLEFLCVLIVILLMVIAGLLGYLIFSGGSFNNLISGKNNEISEKSFSMQNPAENLSVEEAVGEFDESFILYFLESINADELHDSLIAEEPPVIEFVIGNEAYNAVVEEGEIFVEQGSVENEDIVITTTKEEAVKMVKDEDYVKESFLSGETDVEFVADKTTLFAKGYLGLYEQFSGEGITGFIVHV